MDEQNIIPAQSKPNDSVESSQNSIQVKNIVYLLTAFIAGSVVTGLVMAYYAPTPTRVQEPESRVETQPETPVPSRVFDGKEADVVITDEDVVQIVVRNPYTHPEFKTYRYEFSFTRNINDVVETLKVEFPDGEYHEGIKITREEVVLTFRPIFSGVSHPYYDEKPEVLELRDVRLTSSPIYRLSNLLDPAGGYIYVNDYSESCEQFQPIPQACHMDGVIGLSIHCDANPANVNKCDDLVADISVSIEEL